MRIKFLDSFFSFVKKINGAKLRSSQLGFDTTSCFNRVLIPSVARTTRVNACNIAKAGPYCGSKASSRISEL